MTVETAFAPYRLAPGALPEEAARAAEAIAADPLVAAPGEPLPSTLVNRALADVQAGRAAVADEACRAADGTPAGLSGPPRACLASERHQARVAEQIRAALAGGFAGVCLDRPDAPLALGLLGAGFCTECQRDFSRALAREYGDHFQPVDYLALARGAVAQASGAIGFEQLPFGRDFWRVRNAQLERAVLRYARTARDAAREAARPFEVVAHFEAVGPAQLRAARHLDAAIFPGPASPTGIGLFRLLRAALGRRPCAVTPPASLSPGALLSLAAVGATCGVDLSGAEPSGEAAPRIAGVRRLARQLAGRARAPTPSDAVDECAVLYSADADLWTGGRHRRAVLAAVETLAAQHLQAAVVTRLSDASPEATVVLAGAEALAPREAKELLRRLEAGGKALAFGDPRAVDEAGRPAAEFLPDGKPGGVRVGEGRLATLPPFPDEAGARPAPAPLVEKALAALLGKARRAAGVIARTPLLVVLHRRDDALDAHVVTLRGERAQGATLFLGVHLAGGVRRARFQSADGTDVRIPLNPSGTSLSTVLPSFEGYAVVQLPG